MTRKLKNGSSRALLVLVHEAGFGLVSVNGARGTATIDPCVFRSTHCMRRAARPNCHTLTLSYLEPCRAPTESMPAAARSHCIQCLRDLKMLAFVCGLRRWSTNFGRLFVVYLRIAHISRLNFAGTLPGPCRHVTYVTDFKPLLEWRRPRERGWVWGPNQQARALK